MWVPEMKLSKVTLQSFVTGSPLTKKAYVVLERGYAKAPVKEQMKNIISFFSTNRKAPTNEQLEEQSHATKKARSEEDVPLTPQKKKRSYRPMLMEGWCGQARVYIKKFNTILDLKKKSEILKVIRSDFQSFTCMPCDQSLLPQDTC